MSLGLLLMGPSYGVGVILTVYGALYGGAKYVVSGIVLMALPVLSLASA